MQLLQSYLAGRWQTGTGEPTKLVNPTTDEVLAGASSAGLDLGEALRHGRQVGGPALRALSFAERAAALAEMAKVIHAERETLIELGVANAGNTRGDAKFDVDGATATLSAYAHFARKLPDLPYIPDGDGLKLAASPRFHGRHVRVPRLGVAVHINAFNFPAWGIMEKAACALLAGMPVLEKPGTPTALMAEHIAKTVVAAGVLPEGAFQFLAGGAGDLLDHLTGQDVVAFTGSSGTAARLRVHDAFVKRGARLNVEADSLNSVVVGPDVDSDAEVFDMLVREHAREITQKCGQKCTATRRIFVPHELVDAVCESLAEAVQAVKIGDPSDGNHRMGPLTNRAQLESVQAGIARLAEHADVICGGPEALQDVGAFIAPTLLKAHDAENPIFHGDEVFGPVATILPYDGEVASAVRLVAAGQGSLVTSIYSDDRRWPIELGLAVAPWSGRVYLGSSKVAEVATGPGLVLPSMIHGGPGRAGGGEELGGLRGLDLYTQRSAIQGFKALIEAGFGPPAEA